MAITRSIQEQFPGAGNVVDYKKSEAVNNPINATTTTNLALASGAVFRQGKISIRGIAYPGAGAGQCTAIRVIAKNTGASVSHVIAVLPSFAASDLFNIHIPFGPLEFDVASVDIAVTMANVVNGQLTTDFELAVVR